MHADRRNRGEGGSGIRGGSTSRGKAAPAGVRADRAARPAVVRRVDAARGAQELWGSLGGAESQMAALLRYATLLAAAEAARWEQQRAAAALQSTWRGVAAREKVRLPLALHARVCGLEALLARERRARERQVPCSHPGPCTGNTTCQRQETHSLPFARVKRFTAWSAILTPAQMGGHRSTPFVRCGPRCARCAALRRTPPNRPNQLTRRPPPEVSSVPRVITLPP